MVLIHIRGSTDTSKDNEKITLGTPSFLKLGALMYNTTYTNILGDNKEWTVRSWFS